MRKKVVSDRNCEVAVDREIVPLEHVADHAGGNYLGRGIHVTAPLIAVRAIVGSATTAPAVRAADAQQATFPSVAHVECLPCPRRVRSRAETQAMTAGRRTLRAIVSSVLSRIAVGPRARAAIITAIPHRLRVNVAQ